MIHHDSRDYKTAVSEAARKFQRQLEDRIHASVERVEKVIEAVENDVPDDVVVPGKALAFAVAPETNALVVARRVDDKLPTGMVTRLEAIDEKRPLLTIHKHALGQIGERAGIRNLNVVVGELLARGDWGRALVAYNLNQIYSHLNGDRFLLRSVRGELRGFLSDKFRRLDSRPLLEAFIGALREFGARPADGYALGTKVAIRAYLPKVFEPFPGEIMAFGAELRDSDFGDGALALSGFVERMWCTNLATTSDVLNQVHLGKRLPSDVRFSERTLALDTETMASAIKDMGRNVLGAPAINGYLALVKAANAEKVEPSAINAWVKKNLSKTEGAAVAEKFTSMDVETLPKGQTKWRWSNAVSWLARETEDERRKLELQDLAGGILEEEKKR